MKLKRTLYLFLIAGVLISCGGNDKKQPVSNTIDTLNYHEELNAVDSVDSLSVADSLLSAMQNAPVYVDDTAAILLKQRLMADTSHKIGDNVKEEIREARKYMKTKQGN